MSRIHKLKKRKRGAALSKIIGHALVHIIEAKAKLISADRKRERNAIEKKELRNSKRLRKAVRLALQLNAPIKLTPDILSDMEDEVVGLWRD